MNTTSSAAAIRAILSEMGARTKTREIIRRLKEHGVNVSPQQVSNEKARIAKAATNIWNEEDLPISILKKVKMLVDELGSTRLVRLALDELDELTKSR